MSIPEMHKTTSNPKTIAGAKGRVRTRERSSRSVSSELSGSAPGRVKGRTSNPSAMQAKEAMRVWARSDMCKAVVRIPKPPPAAAPTDHIPWNELMIGRRYSRCRRKPCIFCATSTRESLQPFKKNPHARSRYSATERGEPGEAKGRRVALKPIVRTAIPIPIVRSEAAMRDVKRRTTFAANGPARIPPSDDRAIVAP